MDEEIYLAHCIGTLRLRRTITVLSANMRP
jgi:hypothetical protein